MKKKLPPKCFFSFESLFLKGLLLITTLLISNVEGFTQSTLVTYPFTNESASPVNAAQDIYPSDFKISTGNINYGSSSSSSWTGSGTPYAQGSSGWGETSPASAKYFYFTIEADITKIFDINSIRFEYRATANGPSALTVMIDTVRIDSFDVSKDETKVFDTTFSSNDFADFTTTDIKIIGWDNGSRTTSGNGDFRLNDVKVEGEVKLRPVVIDFDYNDRWKKGSGSQGSYQNDHEYEDLGVLFTGGEALRQTKSDRDGFPSAIGEYAWRLRDNNSVSWSATLNREGNIHGFGLKARRWNQEKTIDFNIKYSTDSGQTFTTADIISHTSLNDSSNWMAFQHEIDNVVYVRKGEFIVKIEANSANDQRIMVDDFQYTFESKEPEGWSIDAVDQLFTVNFEDTVEGVVNGSFEGKGFSYAPALGELDSRAWSINGLDGANLDFGNLQRDNNFSKGASPGGAGSGGIYAFEVEPQNQAFGFQQTSDIFTPGEIILKIYNQTGVSISELALAYKIYQYNDQNRSTSLKISYSNDNHSYMPINTLGFVSKENEAASASWKGNLRTTVLSGLTINDGDFFYLRWEIDDAGGSGSRDEFALDDIQLVANPSNNFPPLDSTYQTVTIEGDRTLDSTLAIKDTLTLSDAVVHAGNHKLHLENGAQVKGYGIQNYINGTVKIKGNDNFIIPAGNRQGPENHYGQVSIDNTAGDANDEFSITYTQDTPPDWNAFKSGDDGMQTLSSVEYWEISRHNNTSTPDITLHWNDNDDGPSGVNDPSNIVLAHWNSTKGEWENFGQDSKTGDGNKGSITKNGVDNFSTFTLGSTSNTDPLPVELLSFKGEAEKNRNILRWSTASEINNDFFSLQKSENGKDFSLVTTIEGSGNSNEVLQYEAMDYDVEQEITYYRLKQTDYNGQFSYSDTISVKQHAGDTGEMTGDYWQEQNTLYLDLDYLKSGLLIIEMYDVFGNRVINEKHHVRQSSGSFDWNVSHMDTGVYFIRVANNESTLELKVLLI